MSLFALEAAILRHAWGSPIAIPALFGWSSDGQPVAELWYGDHPRAPTMVFDAKGPRPVGELVAERPDLRGGLRFLLKLLGVGSPLSLQCHPDAAQAARGLADERARGIAFDDPRRSYADAEAKSEMVVALSRFEALAGVSPAGAIRERFARAGVGSLDAILPASDGDVPGFVAALLRLAPAARATALAEAGAGLAAGDAEASDAATRWLAVLLAKHPGDVAALAPLFLEHVALAPGEAIHFGPGMVHAYLEGLALELTGPSDNVLRGGLTGKHVDIDGLLAIADLRPSPSARMAPASDGGTRHYLAPGAGFALDLVDVDGSVARAPADGAEVVIGLAGLVVVTEPDGDELEIGAGDGILVTPGVGISLTGRGRIVIAAAV